MTQDDGPSEPLSDDDLHDCGVRMLLAILRSASTDDIAPRDWWRRAQAALQAGAGMSASFRQMASKMSSKLEIQAPTKRTAQELSSISSELAEHAQFERFRSLCERDAFMVAADAQVVREIERDKYKQRKAADVEFADPFGIEFEGGMSLPATDDVGEIDGIGTNDTFRPKKSNKE